MKFDPMVKRIILPALARWQQVENFCLCLDGDMGVIFSFRHLIVILIVLFVSTI